MYNNELYHFGVKGMKWGHRKARGHAGPGKYVTKKRQQAGDKRDLEALNKGQHLSVGLTKKRQAKFDARDKAAIEKRMAKNEAELNDKPEKKGLSDRQKTALKIGAAAAGTALVAYGAYKAKNAIHYKAYSKSVDEGMAAVNRMEKDLRSARISMDMNAKRAGVDALDLFDAFTKRDERVVNDARRAVYKNASNATRTLGDSIRILRKR